LEYSHLPFAKSIAKEEAVLINFKRFISILLLLFVKKGATIKEAVKKCLIDQKINQLHPNIKHEIIKSIRYYVKVKKIFTKQFWYRGG